MDKQRIEMLEKGIHENFTVGVPFLEQVKKLRNAGIDRYYTDLFALQNTYYASDGSSYTAQLPLSHPRVRGEAFSESEMVDALHANQQGMINYPEFLNRIIKAGVVSYSVYLLGHQVHYMGTKGEVYVQHFPQ